MIQAAAQQIEHAIGRPTHADAPKLREMVRSMIERITISRHESGAIEVGVRGVFAGVMQAAGLVERHAIKTTEKPLTLSRQGLLCRWLRGQDLNLRPSGYEPDELPGCSTPRPVPPRLGVGRYRDRGRVNGGSSRDLGGPGGDRLSRALRHSTMGAEAFDGRVRDGIGSDGFAWATRPAKIAR